MSAEPSFVARFTSLACLLGRASFLDDPRSTVKSSLTGLASDLLGRARCSGVFGVFGVEEASAATQQAAHVVHVAKDGGSMEYGGSNGGKRPAYECVNFFALRQVLRQRSFGSTCGRKPSKYDERFHADRGEEV